eukprot:scaffold2255_cov259-Pinguiococcus_pyrenoidosus.AAC.6
MYQERDDAVQKASAEDLVQRRLLLVVTLLRNKQQQVLIKSVGEVRRGRIQRQSIGVDSGPISLEAEVQASQQRNDEVETQALVVTGAERLQRPKGFADNHPVPSSLEGRPRPRVAPGCPAAQGSGVALCRRFATVRQERSGTPRCTPSGGDKARLQAFPPLGTGHPAPSEPCRAAFGRRGVAPCSSFSQSDHAAAAPGFLAAAQVGREAARPRCKARRDQDRRERRAGRTT